MKSLYRLTAILAVAVLALGAVFLLVLKRPAEKVRDSSEVFLDAEPVDITRVDVTNAYDTYEIVFDNDGYLVSDIPGTLVYMDSFIDFMTRSAHLSALQRVDRGTNDLARYGLENPVATAVITTADRTVTLHVGDRETVSQNYYVSVEGYDDVYVMDSATASIFLLPRKLFITPYVTPANSLSSPLSGLRDVLMTGGPLVAPVLIQSTASDDPAVDLAALSFGTATHIVRGHGVYQLDQTYGIEVLGSLFALTASDVVGYNLTDAELSQYGFDTPYMVVEYDQVSGADGAITHRVLKTVKLEQGGYHVTLAGSGAVYYIQDAAFLNIQYDKLLLRWVATPLIMDLRSVTVENATGRYRFDIDNTDVRNPVITSGGNPVDVTLFRAFFRLITSAAHDGNYLGPQDPQGAPVLTITYAYNNPDKPDDVLALYPGDTRRLNIFINGAGEFAIKDAFATRVSEGCLNLLQGKTIEENW